MLTLQLDSFEEGPIMVEQIEIVIELIKYPQLDNGKISQSINIEYRECYPSEFRGFSIEKQRIEVGQSEYSIPILFQ